MSPVAAGSRLRIAFCVDSLDVGGTEQNMFRQAERLDRDRFDLVVLHGRGGPLLARLHGAGVRTVATDFPSFRSLRSLSAARALRRWFLQEDVAVVHAHDIYSNVLAAMALTPRGPSALIVSRRWGPAHYGRALTWANRLAYARADAVLANSAGVATSLATEEGLDPSRVTVIPNFGDERLFAPAEAGAREALRSMLGVSADALIVGSIANLYPVKDQGTLLRAVASLPPLPQPVHVVLIGEGENRAMLEALARELGIEERVHLSGSIADAGRFHRAFDVSTLTSLSEGFPNTLVEAMAASRAIVATAVGGVADAVVDGETGYLVAPRDYRALAERLGGLLTDPSLRARMGIAGLARARQQFHPGVVMPTLEALYARLAQAHRR